jgi:hypothetical protein
MANLLALVNGQIVEIPLVGVSFVILTEVGGDPRGVNSAHVEQVEWINSNRSKIHMSQSTNFNVQGDVAANIALLTA